MENVITVLIYIIVFGAAAVLALIPAVIAYFVSKKRLGLIWSYFVGVVATLSILGGLCWEPVMLYGDDCTRVLPQKEEYAVRAVSEGVYAQRAPFIPVAIRLEQTQEDYTAWTTYYFPFGTREMELSGVDGYNCTKNLFPW